MEDAHLDMGHVAGDGGMSFEQSERPAEAETSPVAKKPRKSRKTKSTDPMSAEPQVEATEVSVAPLTQGANADAEPADEAAPAAPVADSVFEALLFASDAPLSLRRLADLSECGASRSAEAAIARLNEKYAAMNCAFRIEKLAGGYQLLTTSDHHEVVARLEKQRAQNRLGDAALETLAIIAYRQPIIRADIEAIRGVACGEVLTRLREAGLIRIAGRAEVVGRPLLYATTRKFLDTFGLGGLEDLPASDGLSLPPRPGIRADGADDVPRAQSA